MNRKELDKILLNHKKWLTHSDGWSAEDMANLQFADLRGMDLSETNLCCANLQAADLRGADLHGAKLWDADLLAADIQDADLRNADLWIAGLRDADIRHANLRRSKLWGAVLSGADLSGADLSVTDLREANLLGADLRDADLRDANMVNANLWDADLRGANLGGADLSGVKTNAATKIDWPMVCPETGAFIAWKKAFEYVGHVEKRTMIVKLEIPEDALRSSATTNKCRSSWAKVLEIQNIDGTKADVTEAESAWGTMYKVGEMVYPDDWDYNRWNECSNGIHFFMTREEAVAW